MLSASAIHEAGHAAVALALAWRVATIELANAFGGCTDASPPPSEERDWREHVLVLLGGGVSEQLFAGGAWDGTANVEDEREEALEECCRHLGREAGPVEVTRLTDEARSLVSQRRDLVAALADAAIRRRGLTELEIRAIVEATC